MRHLLSRFFGNSDELLVLNILEGKNIDAEEFVAVAPVAGKEQVITTMVPALHAIAELLALRIIDSLAWGTVIVVFAALVLRAKRMSASTRFAVWFSALVAIGVLPLISGAWWPRGVVLAGTASRPVITLPDQSALYLSAAWALVAGWFVVGVGRAVWHLHALRRDCVAIDPAMLDPLLQETLRCHRMNREVALCTSEQMRVPTAIGLLKPAVVIPGWVMRELTPGELNQILLHELAHLRRWDDWTNLAQQVVKAIFFFHPAVWWIEKRVALEREMACDDAVLAETSSPHAYAECLAHLAEKSFLQRSVVLAQAALGKIRHTSLRVARILEVKRPADSLGWKPAVSLVAACAIACAVWSPRAPRLIVFQNSASVRATGPVISSLSPRAITENVSYRMPRPHVGALQTAPTLPKLNAGRNRRNFAMGEHDVAVQSASSKPRVVNTGHLTSAKSVAAPFIETLFVVIEGNDPGSPDLRVYQIQMFRVTILHQSPKPVSNRTPRKET